MYEPLAAASHFAAERVPGPELALFLGERAPPS